MLIWLSMSEKIAIIPIEGAIFGEKSMLFLPIDFSDKISRLKRYISKAADDKDVKGIVFEIDSPGGSPYYSKELTREIKEVKKPKVARIEENCLSGAYWIASSCDKIVCDELSRVGGIGVAGIRVDLSDFMKKFGIQVDTSVTGRFKDLGMPFKPFGMEEKEIIDEELNLINDLFLNEIVKSRNIDKDRLKEIKDGKYFLGLKAKEIGLVDYIGGRKEAIDICKKLAGIDGDVEIEDYRKEMEEESFKGIGDIFKMFFDR